MRDSRSTPLASRAPKRAAVSTPLANADIYRSGSLLALVAIVVPVLIAVGGAGYFLGIGQRVPRWLALVPLLYLPLLPLLWFALQSVRLHPETIGVGRAWQPWREVRWALIEHVEKVGPLVRIRSSDGRRLTFAPILLRDGDKLIRALLLRLPPQVLAGSLHESYRRFIMGDVYPAGHGGLSGTVKARPASRWRLLALVGIVAGGAGAVLLVLGLPLFLGIPLALLSAALSAAGVVAFSWLTQVVIVNERGITTEIHPWRRLTELRWDEVELIETAPQEFILRLRGQRRLRCAGPGLMLPPERDLLRAFLNEYCTGRGVPVVRRRFV